MQHDDYHVLEAAFVDGFRQAADKRAFLHLARIPHEIKEGGLKLLEVRFNDRFTVGSASPGFGSSELVYQPLPGEMVSQQTGLAFVYVSAKETREMSFADILKIQGEIIEDGHSHTDGPHHHHYHA